MSNNYIKTLDPIQGLYDYVQDIKPYHTKIIEVLIEYVYDDDVKTVFSEHLQLSWGPTKFDFSPFTCYGPPIFPFPYREMFIDHHDPGYNPLTTYYNDPTLDAVQLNVRLQGTGWESTVHDVYYGVGLQETASPSGVFMPGIHWWNDSVVPSFNFDGTSYSPYKIDAPLSNKYVGGRNAVGPQPQGTYVYPGVATVNTWDAPTYPDMCQAPCYGTPMSFEAWFSCNETKTNPDVQFSGYTNYGEVDPETCGNLEPVVSGYYRRFVSGIVRTGAVLETLTTNDVVFGILFEGTPTGGEGYICVNGVIIKTVTVAYKPERVRARVDTWYVQHTEDPDYGIFGFSQGYNFCNLQVNNLGSTNLTEDFISIGQIGSPPAPSPYYPIDTYDVKFAYYLDFVPDAGPGTFCGYIQQRFPAMVTHPGRPNLATGSPIGSPASYASLVLDGDFSNAVDPGDALTVIVDGARTTHTVGTVSYLYGNTNIELTTPYDIGTAHSVLIPHDVVPFFAFDVTEINAEGNYILVSGPATATIFSGQEILMMGSSLNDGELVVTGSPTFNGLVTKIPVVGPLNEEIVGSPYPVIEPARYFI